MELFKEIFIKETCDDQSKLLGMMMMKKKKIIITMKTTMNTYNEEVGIPNPSQLKQMEGIE